MPGQHVVDLAEVDVARDRALLGPLEVDLGDLVVLEDGDALLADVDGDEELALRGRQRRTARRLAAAAAARALGAAALLPLRELALLRLLALGLLLAAFAARPAGFAWPRAGFSAFSAPPAARRGRRCRASCARVRRGYRGGASGGSDRLWRPWPRRWRRPGGLRVVRVESRVPRGARL